MKPKRIKSVTEKIANVMIVALVAMGAIAFAAFSHISDGGEFASKMFLIFFGAIITMQAIPGLILLGAMLKGIAGFGNKDKVAVGPDGDKSDRH